MSRVIGSRSDRLAADAATKVLRRNTQKQRLSSAVNTIIVEHKRQVGALRDQIAIWRLVSGALFVFVVKLCLA